MDIVVEKDYYNNGEILTLFIGFYDSDGEFNGCAWDSHEQCNEWIIMGRTLWNKCDGDEDTMRFHFKDNFGEDVLKLIDDTFNKDYYLESGTIFKKHTCIHTQWLNKVKEIKKKRNGN